MNLEIARARRAFALLFFSAILLSFTSLTAQETRGIITGRVVDASGAVISGASVQITDVARGTSVSLTTNESGFFQATYLLPGSYKVVASATGFKKYIREGITVEMAETRDVQIPLEVGGTGESVVVVADATGLETTTSSVGEVVEQRTVAELPLVHGDPYTLIGQSTGVTFARDPRLDRPFEPTHIVGFTMDGTRANRSDLMIDGMVSTARANANEVTSSYVPPTDLIQEFKVQTATYDSQFGNTEGGVTTISIKSGTNKLHGTGYYWKEPGNLAANDYFGKLRGQPRPDTFSNRYGGTVTGPVTLPKLYDGRDRTFFTFGWEGIRDSRPRYDSTSPTVPTEAMRNGDFSYFLTLPNPSQYQIYNPFTRKKDSNRPGHFVEDPFPNNIIPQNLINPVSKALLQFIPLPRSPAALNLTNNNQDSTLAEKTKKYDNFTVRMDHNLSQKQKVFARASWYHREGFYNDYFHDIATGTDFQFISRQAVLDDVYTINSTTVLNVRYGYNRFIRFQDMPTAGFGFDLTSVGFPAAYNAAIPASIRRFPRLDFPANTYQGTGQTNEFRPDDTHSAAVILNKALGLHSLKTGMEFRSYRQNDLFASNSQTGQFVFDNTYTRQSDTSSPTQVIPQAFASFLLGIPSSVPITAGQPATSVTRAADFAEQSTTWGFFVQDDWKLTPRLSLNLGLRYEFETPMTERFNKSVTGFDPNYIQPIEAQVQANYSKNPTPEIPPAQFLVRGGLQFAGVNGQSRGLYNTPKKDFMPRIGFAYSLNQKTVINGGYGIFYGFLGQRRGDVLQSGFSQVTNFVPTTDGEHITGSLSNPFPNGILDPSGAALGPRTNLGQSITFFNQHPKAPYMQRWGLGVQRELPGGMVFRADYVGNRGTHIEISRNLNVTPQQYLSTSPTRDATRIAYLTASVNNPFYGVLSPSSVIGGSQTIARERLLRPFPEFDSVTTTTNDGYSWYHSGQFSLSKRFSKGYSLQASYTYSKYMQATELLNQDDPRPTRVISDQDYPHRLTITPIYELPFGKGRTFLSNSNGIISRIVGGWQLQGVYAFQSGAPINGTAGFGNLIYNGDPRNMVLPSDKQSILQWFNTSGFVTASASQLANNVRTFPLRFSFLRTEHTNNVDFSILKDTSITEQVKVQFRGEFLNAFNHPLFPTPNMSVTSTTFGQITASNQANYPRRVQLGLKAIF